MSHLPFADPHANRTLLPDDVAATAPTDSDPFEVAAEFPASSLAWAVLAELALANGTREGVLQAYAFARTGYHRGLDALRRMARDRRSLPPDQYAHLLAELDAKLGPA